jgi:septal ring factor EnvC (AmiA/AmiB activator)
MIETVLSAITGTAAAIIGGIYLVASSRAKAAGDRDVARGPDWDAFTNQQRQEIQGLKADMKESRERVRGLEKEMRTMEGRLDALERKYRAALAFIRQLLVLHPERRKDVPVELEADI